MPLSDYHNIYMLGIGGIGMSALARYFAHQGHYVAGYDRTSSAITRQLQDEGIRVHYGGALADAPDFLFTEADQTLVVYTPAITTAHPVLAYVTSHSYPLKKRSAVLGELSTVYDTIAVGGAHGKTSTSAFIAHVLRTAGIPFYGFLGGISTNYQTNFLAPPQGQTAALMLTEADEYDRSFLELQPEVTVLTSTDADHLDIYETASALYEAYQQFTTKTRSGGRLIHPLGFALPSLAKGVRTQSFQLEEGDGHAANLQVANHQYHFDLTLNESCIRASLPVPGRHNVLNTIAGALATQSLVSPTSLQQAIQTYAGVRRRFEVVIETAQQVLIDDYAHHPGELDYTIATIRELYPAAAVTGIFQPHLYSRTRDFAASFAKRLSALDRVVLLPIYPAREEPIAGVSSQLIYDQVENQDKYFINKSDVYSFIERDENNLLVTLGAGDIADIIPGLKEVVKAKAYT
jgi:UDP-N-acetylmuramate--alanine ligase